MSLYRDATYGIKRGTAMKGFLMKMVPVSLKDHFPFRCRRCGACCRHVRESVPMESLDAFRLAKYLRDKGEKVNCIDDVLVAYTEPVLLSENGYTVFMLKTVGADDACIFLKDNRCTIHKVNPRACRTYPIAFGPYELGGYEQYLSMEQAHHYSGPQMSVKKWIQKRCSKQDLEFLNTDVGSVQEIERLLKQIPERNRTRAVMLFIFYKSSDFDLDRSFMEQFMVNNQKLLEALRKLAQTGDTHE